MGLFDFMNRAFRPPHPRQVEVSSFPRLHSPHTGVVASTDIVIACHTQNPPPSYREVTATKLWKVDLWFGSDPDLLREAIPQVKLNNGWQAHLELFTTDIVGLMREGLYVSQENVIVQESCLTLRPYQQEHKKYYYDRNFALTGPSWKGKLVVTTLSCPIATNFRVKHLSADKTSIYLTSGSPFYLFFFLFPSSEISQCQNFLYTESHSLSGAHSRVPKPPNPPSSSPLHHDASPPAGQGQAANATVRPLEVHALLSPTGAPQGAAVGWQLPALIPPGSGSREALEVETAYHTGWVGAVLLGAGYIFIHAMKVYTSL
ncbi:hypothetical protein BKA60DRAFT_542332 [Fusarium oxysporum]|nr:hypothetical protein BKA60DRAFT_542332 [Fusarium oxysporum]